MWLIEQHSVQVDGARRCFHGVPRVLHLPHALSPSTTLPGLYSSAPSRFSQSDEGSDSKLAQETFDWHLIQHLLQDSRININIRQVEE
jgi:hypothetical protein